MSQINELDEVLIENETFIIRKTKKILSTTRLSTNQENMLISKEN